MKIISDPVKWKSVLLKKKLRRLIFLCMQKYMAVELADFLENYSSSFNPGIQAKTSSKYEFNELDTTINRPGRGRGVLLPHQKLFSRYIRAHDLMLVLDEPGTGKTCLVTGFTEWSFHEVQKNRLNPREADPKLSHLKRIVILVKNKTHLEEIKRQLVCKCSDGHYERDAIKISGGHPSQHAINKLIFRAGYEVMTYRTFASNILKDYPDDESIINAYSNTIFWVDEAHLVPDEGTDYDDDDSPLPDDGGRYKTNKQVVYKQLHRVFHLVQRCKIIMTTATPMINDTSLLSRLLNLLIPKNGQLPQGYDYKNATDRDLNILFPTLSSRDYDKFRTKMTPEEAGSYYEGQFPSDYNFDDKTIEEVEPRIRGMISFVRAADTGAVSVDIGEVYSYKGQLGDTTYDMVQTIYVSQMSDFQSENYYRAVAQDNSFQDDEVDEERGGLRIKQRQASNFIFPDGHWGGQQESQRAIGESEGRELGLDSDDLSSRTGFKRYITKTGKKYHFTEEFEEQMKGETREETLQNIYYHGCKYGSIISLVDDPTDKGTAFAFQEHVEGSGTITLAACLELMGYEQYEGKDSLLKKVEVTGYCPSADIREIRKLDIAPAKRYALLTEETSNNFDNVLELFNSYENRNGEYIKILISSKVGREGINLSNCTQRHLIGPDWNMSNMLQALARALRATSHLDKLQDEQEKLMAQGKDPSQAKVIVKTYLHAAIPNPDFMGGIRYREDMDVGTFKGGKYSQEAIASSSDLYMYRRSGIKEIPIAKMLKILKQCAVTCQLNRERNIKSTDIDYTRECHYDKCDYDCFEPDFTTIDFTTYDLVYSNEVVSQIVRDLSNVFNQVSSITLASFQEMIGEQYRTNLVIKALNYVISNNIPLLDRSGFTCYLREDGERYYLTDSYSLDSEYIMKDYVDNSTFYQRSTINEIIEARERDRKKEMTFSGDDETNRSILRDKSIPLRSKIPLIENLIARQAKGIKSPTMDLLWKCSDLPIFEWEIAESFISTYFKEKGGPAKRGRPAGEFNISGVNLDEFVEKKYKSYFAAGPKKKFIVHSLYSLTNQSNSNYSVIPDYRNANGVIRIFDPEDKENRPGEPTLGWRDADEDYVKIFNPLLQYEIEQRISQKVADGEKYGFSIGNLVYIAEQDSSKDRRKRSKGRNCDSMKLEDIQDILYYHGYNLDELPDPESSVPQNYISQLNSEANRGGAARRGYYCSGPVQGVLAKTGKLISLNVEDCFD